MENIVSMLDCVPVGFRFRPTDEELVEFYLKHKLLHDDFPVQIIPEIDLCKVEPWDIPAKSVIKSEDPEWFFFSPIDYKYSNSKRFNRTTKRGFWKSTGKDRQIKTSGTNNIIGRKKTLVFHSGRVPTGVNTNWVIHEYHHAVNYPENQRTFVLCRLIKKPEKKSEGGTNALIYDQGESSRHMASSDRENWASEVEFSPLGAFPDINMERIFDEIHQTQLFSPPVQQSPIGIDMQTSFETTEEEDDFFNSIWAQENITSEERKHAFVTSSIQSESLRRVFNESSDTDAEVVSTMHGDIVDTCGVCNEHPSSSEYHVSKMFKSSHGSAHGGVHLLSSEANKEKKDRVIRDDYWAAETSSCDSNGNKPLEINCIEISSSPSTLRRWKTQHHPRSENFISQRAVARRSQTHRKVSNKAVSHVEDLKLTVEESGKDLKNAQNSSSKENFQTKSHQSSYVNKKGSFIFLETPSSCQSLVPRSVYLVNVVIGIVLLIVISLDVLSC
ncbi:NAC domain-containing protein 105-like [Abrus precatorius]|uniref:NAC domain-containing protein 105-like n=1 Tax=Abrus precatorius TaxID=3816 RepID=A0A8B8JVL6_ABRPR|nr:NAC domain-containing protein 105-like [Abrus precatorius]